MIRLVRVSLICLALCSCTDKTELRSAPRTLHNRKFNNKTQTKISYKKSEIDGGDWRVLRMRDSDMSEAHIQNLQLQGAVFESVPWRGTLVEHTNMDGVKASGNDFSGARFEHSSLYAANISFCNFSKSRFIDVDLRESVSIGANFAGAQFDEKTKLPFSRDEAEKRGMQFTP